MMGQYIYIYIIGVKNHDGKYYHDRNRFSNYYGKYHDTIMILICSNLETMIEICFQIVGVPHLFLVYRMRTMSVY